LRYIFNSDIVISKHILAFIYNLVSGMQELKIKQIADGLSYNQTEKLGKGAFGDVYLGFD